MDEWNDLAWDDWRFVHAAWKTGSFTAAAEVLHVGQATVSRRVAQVEERVGHVLFDRHRTGLVPTEAVRAVLPHLEALAAAAHGASRALEGLEVAPEGTVRVAAPPGMCVDWMPVLAARLSVEHPGVNLEVLADILPRDLERREADIALRMVPSPDSDLVVRRLTSVSGGLFATPEVVARLPPNPTMADVPMVHWAGEHAEIALGRFLRQLSPGPPAFATNDYLVLRAAVLAGLGASLLSETEARTHGLVPVPVPLELPTVDVFLVVHRALRKVPRVSVVIDAIDALVAAL
ncbi:MAG: LysR family transcriptional regulator [Myxococcota bacterium]